MKGSSIFEQVLNKVYRHIIYKIPPHLPFPKGGNIPLFGQRGVRGDFWVNVVLLVNSLVGALHPE